jgi:hypothetical protein
MGGLRTVRYDRIWDHVSSDSIDQFCEGLVTLLYIVLDAYISNALRFTNLNREWHSGVGSYGSCIDAAQLIRSPMHLESIEIQAALHYIGSKNLVWRSV